MDIKQIPAEAGFFIFYYVLDSRLRGNDKNESWNDGEQVEDIWK